MLEGLSLVFCLRQRISRLTLREDPHSEIPLGLSCSGEASLTLLCRAFTPNLENAGKHTVHISDLRRFEPNTVFEIRQQSNSACWPVSQPGQPTRKTLDWVNIRLKTGEKTEYTTRPISPRRSIDALNVGSYTLHVVVASAEVPNAETDLQDVPSGVSSKNVDCTVFRYVVRDLAHRQSEMRHLAAVIEAFALSIVLKETNGNRCRTEVGSVGGTCRWKRKFSRAAHSKEP